MKRHLANWNLHKFAADFYLPQKLRVTSRKTRETYVTVIRDFERAIGRPAKVIDLTDEHVCLMLRALADRKLSPHTIQQRRNYLMALCNFCSKRGIIDWWVAVERFPTPDVVPRAWTMAEMRQLLAACDQFPGDYFGIHARRWWRAFHMTLWDTAERTSAVLAIHDEWVNLDTRVLDIPGPARKGGRKGATYELTPETIELLRPLVAYARASGRHLVFAFPGCRCTFYNHYTRLLKLAGLPSGRRNKPQKIRRTFATFVELAGGDATEALGHSCRRVTVESYIDPTVVRKPPANRLLPPLLPPGERAG